VLKKGKGSIRRDIFSILSCCHQVSHQVIKSFRDILRKSTVLAPLLQGSSSLLLLLCRGYGAKAVVKRKRKMALCHNAISKAH
jgi:hypothetical protein